MADKKGFTPDELGYSGSSKNTGPGGAPELHIEATHPGGAPLALTPEGSVTLGTPAPVGGMHVMMPPPVSGDSTIPPVSGGADSGTPVPETGVPPAEPPKADDDFSDFPEATSASVPPSDDEFSDFPEADPSSGQDLSALGEGAAGGAISNSSVLGGITLGAELGSMAGPIGAVGGGLSGALLGYFAGEKGKSLLGVRSADDMPPNVRKFGYAGEMIGGSLPFIGGAIGLGKTGIELSGLGKPGQYLNRIIRYAGKHPVHFGRTELAGAGAAALGGYGMESVNPGEALPRLGMEMAAGFFSPTRLLSGTARGAIGLVKRSISHWSPSGQRTSAGQELRRIVDTFGEDVETLYEGLKASSPLSDSITAAQKTASPALIALEARLSKENAKFGADVRRMGETALSTLKDLVVALKGVGDPEALLTAAKIRARYFRALVAGRVSQAVAEAVKEADKISADTPDARGTLSEAAFKALTGALEQLRAVENGLWSKVPRDVPSAADNILQQVASLKAEMLPEERLPDVIEGFVRRMQEADMPEITPENAREAAERLFTPGAKPFTSVKEQVDAAIKAMAESMLRQKVDEINGGIGNSGSYFTHLLGPDGVGVKNLPTTSGELIRFRSRMLSLAKDAMAQGRPSDARALGLLASAALDDLSAIGARTGDSAFDEARTFSRELNDVFTRTFAGDALKATRTGADRLPPEMLLQHALGSGGVQGDLRLRQLQEAIDFLTAKGIDSPEALAKVQVMHDAQARIIRLDAGDAVNPNTGRVNATRLRNYLRKNETLLSRFPEVKNDIENALSAEDAARATEHMAAAASRPLEQETAFAQLAKVDSAATAVKAALAGPTPQRDMEAFAKLAKRGGPDAVAGLRSATMGHLIDQATGGNGVMSFAKLDDLFNRPMRDGLPSLRAVLTNSGVIGAEDVGRLNQILAAGENVETALAGGNVQEAKLIPHTNALIDMALRIAGSKMGGRVSKMLGGGSTLIAQSAGSKYAREMFEKMGVETVTKALIEAASSPRLMALLLEHPSTDAEGMMQARNLHAYLLSAGLLGAEHEARQNTDGIQQEQNSAGDGLQEDQNWTSMLSGAFNKLMGEPSGKYLGDAPKEGYPAPDQGVTYGSGNEGIVASGRVRDATGLRGDLDVIAARLEHAKAKPLKGVADILASGAVAAQRNAITGLGFDPRTIAVENSGKDLTVGGFYDPKRDVTMVSSATPSAVAHEATHRGLQVMMDSGKLTPDEIRWVKDHNEMIVRYIMSRDMGDVEGSQGPIAALQRHAAENLFSDVPEAGKTLASIEKKAQGLYAELHAHGPH